MRLISKIITVVIAIALVAGVAPAATPAQSPAGSLIDLPWATLTPADAEAVGISGLGRFENGHYRTIVEYTAIRSDFLNIPLTDVETALTDAGYLQGYTSNLGIPQEPGNPDSPPSRVVFSSIYQYQDEEGASAAFAFNTEYSGVTIATIDTSITPSAPFGNEIVMTRTTSTTMEEEGPSDQVDTVFRVGSIVAATGIIDYGMTVDSVQNPAPVDPELVTQVEQLAARLIERITVAQEGMTPGLANVALSLVATGADPGFSSEGYRRIDGEDIPAYNGYVDDFAEIVTPDVTAAYEVAQGLGSPSGDPFDPYFGSRLFGFADDTAAREFLAQVPDSLPAGFTVVDGGASSLSDNAILIEYAFEVGPGMVAEGYQVWQQSGSVVAMLLLESADHRPAQDIVLGLAEAQLACFSSPCEPQQLPAGW
jgi:hypothetical protein